MFSIITFVTKELLLVFWEKFVLIGLWKLIKVLNINYWIKEIDFFLNQNTHHLDSSTQHIKIS